VNQAPSTGSAKETIPVVDFDGVWSDDPKVRARTAADLGRALEVYGFLYLKNHRIPTAVVKTMFDQSRKLFYLPQEAKEALRQPQGIGRGERHGYEGVGHQALGGNPGGDLKEIFHCGPERPGATPNIWPKELPEFKEAAMAFHEAAAKAGNRFYKAIAVALALSENYFDGYFDHSEALLRINHYPPVQGAVVPRQIRAGAHTDFGGITLLFNDGEGGLEVQDRDGSWIPAPVVEGACIVNTGDLTERWSNGRFRSTMHRVVMPVAEAAKRDRYSIAFFFGPNKDAVISCLPTCQDAEHPPKFPPITALEHVRARVAESRKGVTGQADASY
jgi:isopenicillin N synthase-like dioxygenase